MPLQREPIFSADKTRTLSIDLPCFSGLNLNDLEYEQDANFSPKVLNMLYRNGTFGKRRGQKTLHDFESTIYNTVIFNEEVFVHCGTKIYKGLDNPVQIYDGIAEQKGLFINFNRMLYYICDKFYVYQKNPENNDVWSWGVVEPYIPDLVINRKPDGSESDLIESYNLIGKGFKNTFHGDTTSTIYVLTTKDLDNYDSLQDESIKPKVEINGEEWTYDPTLATTKTFKVDYTEGKITLSQAAGEGVNNVVITAYKTEQKYIDKIMASKYYCNFGGNNNSRLFLAGGGESIYYYSEVFDATYFPENNYASVGNGEEDITGFGQQYNVLIVYKPREMYSLTYYVQDSNDTTQEEQVGKGAFQSQVVNARIGCDVPDSIQLINNELVWLSTTEGVCILTSTNILDERNVRPISRNINGGYRKPGLLQEENLKNAISIDYDNKYWLSVNGKIYLWDYAISPYANTGDLDKDAKRLSWFLFDNFNVGKFVKYGLDLIWQYGSKINTISQSYDDFGDPIQAIYQTPLFQFNAENYLKNVNNVFVQVRADTAAKIEMYYITEEEAEGEREPEDIVIGSKIWKDFHYFSFMYKVINFGNMFRRKCSLKKVQMAGILFKNNEFGRDMSISHLSFEYKLVKTVK